MGPATNTVGTSKTLSSFKPAPIPGWKLEYDPLSTDKNLNQKVTWTALKGNELYDSWQLQVSLRIAVNCGALSDPLIQPCGTTDAGAAAYGILFPAVQYLCKKDGNGDCISTGATEDWTQFSTPSTFTGRCNAAASAPVTVLKMFQAAASVSASCPALSVTPRPFALPATFSANATGVHSAGSTEAASPTLSLLAAGLSLAAAACFSF